MPNTDLRPLVKVTQHSIALLFCDYLKTLQVQTLVEKAADGFVIYCQQDKYDFAQQEFAQFINQPEQAKYQQAAWQNGDVTEVSSSFPTLMSRDRKSVV